MLDQSSDRYVDKQQTKMSADTSINAPYMTHTSYICSHKITVLPFFVSPGLNSVQLIGYTGSDPLRGSTEFQPTKFSLATTVYYKTRNGKKYK